MDNRSGLRLCRFDIFEIGSPCLNDCGYRLKKTYLVTPRRNCRGIPGLGDRLATFLRRTGAAWLYLQSRKLIYTTEEVDGGCGGCKRRQEVLNRFGAWSVHWWRRLTDKIRRQS